MSMTSKLLNWLNAYGVFFGFFLVVGFLGWKFDAMGEPPMSLLEYLGGSLGAGLLIFGFKWLFAWLTGLPPHR